MKLLLSACEIEETYQELIEYLVCSTDNKDCMLRHCTECPNNRKLKQFLKDKFDEYDSEDEISYNMWVSTDRTQQATFHVTLEEYIEKLLSSLEELISHSFIAKQQGKFLQDKKANLKENEAILVLDFSQNYSYCIQDKVQGAYWSHESCSLHPAVLYTFSEKEEPIKSSMCVISDDLNHDVAFVYETQKVIVEHIKECFPKVQYLLYFSDGCVGQYKNCKNFLNLCFHHEDFDIAATWSFFATSHEQSSCDGVGGTTKCLLRKASLQIDCGENIDTALKVYKFCSTEIDNIKYWFVPSEKMLERRQQLTMRFSLAKNIPGTRSYHHFEPSTTMSIETRRISYDPNYYCIFNFSEDQESSSVKMSGIFINSYIACSYDDHYFFGLILSKHKEGDVLVKCMHPRDPLILLAF